MVQILYRSHAVLDGRARVGQYATRDKQRGAKVPGCYLETMDEGLGEAFVLRVHA